MEETYKNIFTRLGLNFRVVQADSGQIGGDGSKEFMILADSGEDDIVVCDACDYLLSEAENQGGRILALSIHPWMLGQPHRIAKLEQVLEYVMSQEKVWSASIGEIHSCWKSQQ